MNEHEPQPPTDIAGVGIHLAYIWKDIKKMSDKLDLISNNYVNNDEHIHFKEFVEKTFVTKDENKAEIQRIERLEDNQRWLVRTVLGIVIAALLGLIMTIRSL